MTLIKLFIKDSFYWSCVLGWQHERKYGSVLRWVEINHFHVLCCTKSKTKIFQQIKELPCQKILRNWLLKKIGVCCHRSSLREIVMLCGKNCPLYVQSSNQSVIKEDTIDTIGKLLKNNTQRSQWLNLTETFESHKCNLRGFYLYVETGKFVEWTFKFQSIFAWEHFKFNLKFIGKFPSIRHKGG